MHWRTYNYSNITNPSLGFTGKGRGGERTCKDRRGALEAGDHSSMEHWKICEALTWRRAPTLFPSL